MSGRNALWAPDFVLESSGVACGDRISLYAFREGQDRLYFRFICRSCTVSRRMAQYLEETCSGQPESVVYGNVVRLMNEEYKDGEEWIAQWRQSRSGCIEAPVSLLKELFGQSQSRDSNEPAALACDACVQMRRVNWDAAREQGTESRKSVLQVLRQVKQGEAEEEYALQELGLACLSREQAARLASLMENMSESQVKRMKKLRLAPLLLNNCTKYKIVPHKEVKSLALKQAASMKVADEEIGIVQDFIHREKLSIESVKGNRTNKYYPEDMYRTHMDYDFLAPSCREAFVLIDYLVNQRGFKLVIGGSVPFSFKAVIDENGAETLTGHIHLEKILQDKYQAVIDINMGGFPLGRTGIIRSTGGLSAEDLVCITLAHLFKHEHAYIKDINDLYYLLNSEDIDGDRLEAKIRQYRLENLFSIACKLIDERMGLKKKYKVRRSPAMKLIAGNDWAFSRSRHFRAKAFDMFLLNCSQMGLIKGMKETKCQIAGEKGAVASQAFPKLCQVLNQRSYLYPIVLFRRYRKIQSQALEKLAGAEEICEEIYVYKRIVVLPIGLFLLYNREQDSAGREETERQVMDVVRALEIEEGDCSDSYIMEARKDTWLY